MAVIVDTGPLYALADAGDRHHPAAADFLRATGETLLVPVSILPELCYLLAGHLGADAEARAVRSLALGEGGFRLESLNRGDLMRAAELVTRYADAKLGFVDASVVAMAERFGIRRVFTLDRRHFGAVRPRHCEAFELVP